MELKEYEMADLLVENARYRMALEAVEALLDNGTRTMAVVTKALKKQAK